MWRRRDGDVAGGGGETRTEVVINGNFHSAGDVASEEVR